MGSTSPTNTAPPPSYQMSLEEFDKKTSQAIRNTPPVDEDGWEVYDPAAFEATAESRERSPPSCSTARILGTDTNRHGRRSSSSKVLPSTPMKIRTSRRNSPSENEHRVASPPPPFTPTGPSLDGPPFDEVIGPSYYASGPDSPTSEPYPPSPRSPSPPPRVFPSVEPLRLRRSRLQNSQLQTSSNPYSSHRPISSRSDPASTVARVEFDPQTAYSPYGTSGVGDYTHVRADATAFYNHAVASHLTASSVVSAQTQPGYLERVSSSYSGGYTPTPGAQATSSGSFHEQHVPRTHNLHLGGPAMPPVPLPPQTHPTYTGVGHGRTSSPTGTIGGPLPPAPNSLSSLRWAESESQIAQDVYGGEYGGHG